MGQYYVAQICLNGHIITGSADEYPMFKKKFCPDCGQPTIMQCKYCKADIQGNYDSPGVFDFGNYKRPTFCHNCGNPYPWTEEKLNAALKLIAEDDELSDSDKQILSQSLPDLMINTSKTQLAATRFKKFVRSATSVTGEGLKQILVEVVSETAKKLIWS